MYINYYHPISQEIAIEEDGTIFPLLSQREAVKIHYYYLSLCCQHELHLFFVVILMTSTYFLSNILHLKSSRKRVSKLAETQFITSGLYLLPINEENLALKKHRLPEASLRPIFQKEKIRWARHCQDIKRAKIKVSSLRLINPKFFAYQIKVICIAFYTQNCLTFKFQDP
ncbi:hypothetical protein Anas_13224 [Armadillidium nasatum]|uniref:Uncharacterized protein n=1 Tax=Armadillidium nasatum TaxID=96803 RepID=A0A5N5T5M2_9CRUS|nr:hypothetical protein Anas_13224 [Armadillidium nasatum]